jgi:septum formation protein
MSRAAPAEQPVILASASPRRAELLERMRIPFEVVPSRIDESVRPGENFELYVGRMAREKAAACQIPGRIILAADTIVEIDGRILGKPANREAGIAMLSTLSGREHRVLTAVAVTDGDQTLTECVTVRVWFTDIGEREAQAYWDSGEPADKAGGYGIQGIGGIFASSIEGSYSAVVGLPLAQTERLLTRIGVDTWRCRTHG